VAKEIEDKLRAALQPGKTAAAPAVDVELEEA
jgi:hypothetical protein